MLRRVEVQVTSTYRIFVLNDLLYMIGLFEYMIMVKTLDGPWVYEVGENQGLFLCSFQFPG